MKTSIHQPRDAEAIRARWQPIVGLKAYLTGATGGEAARLARHVEADGSVVHGMSADEMWAHPGAIGAAITFARDGQNLDISPNDLLAVLSEAAIDIFSLLDQLDQREPKRE